MKKIVLFAVIMLVSLFTATITSCSNDEKNSIETGNTSYYDGDYSGDQLSLTIDEKSAADSKVTIKFSDNKNFKAVVSGFPDANSDINFDGVIDDNGVATGNFETSNKVKYNYNLGFNGLYGKVKLIMVCKKVE